MGTENIDIGPNGNWHIDGVDQNVSAIGQPGPTGPKGDKGDRGDTGDVSPSLQELADVAETAASAAATSATQAATSASQAASAVSGMLGANNNWTGTNTFQGPVTLNNASVLAPNVGMGLTSLTNRATSFLGASGLSIPTADYLMLPVSNIYGNAGRIRQVGGITSCFVDGLNAAGAWYRYDVEEVVFDRTEAALGALLLLGTYAPKLNRTPLHIQLTTSTNAGLLAPVVMGDNTLTLPDIGLRITLTRTTVKVEKPVINGSPAYDQTYNIPAGKQVVGVLTDGQGTFAAGTFRVSLLLQDAALNITNWQPFSGAGGLETYRDAAVIRCACFGVPQYHSYSFRSTLYTFPTRAAVDSFLSAIPTHS